MNRKSIIVSCLLSIIIVTLYIINEYYEEIYQDANVAYQVYLGGKDIGIIKKQDELYSLINNEQQEIKDKYGVDYVYPPNGLDIVEVNTYNNNYEDINNVYQMIEAVDNFTIKGYIVTIKPSSGEKIVINVLDRKVFDESIKRFILSFISESQFNNYINGNRSINDIGSIISDMYFKESITIKEGYISVKDKIFTDTESLSQYLLFGPDAQMDNYTVKIGDSIASISEAYQINPQEFLIANPQYKDENALLVVGSNVNVTLINPVINLSYKIYEINEHITPFTINYTTDNTKSRDYSEITKSGVDGITLIHDQYEVVNGSAASGVEILDRVSIRDMIVQEVTIGRKDYGTGTHVILKGEWSYPTKYPFLVTSPFGWRSHKQHLGVDISGTGHRSPIYSVANGTVVEVGFRNTDGNFVIIQHENNIYTQYAHLYQSIVSVGQTVKKGEQIGEMGESGLAFGVHLHFGVSIGWPYHGSYSFQNPSNYIRLR